MQVLFICVHNAGRSQMAETFFNALAPEGMRAVSAGTEPAEKVNPTVVEAMAEVGIDIRDARPSWITPERIAAQSGRVITMGCGVKESCPVYLGMRIDEDWELDDPAEKPLEEVRRIRDAVRDRVKNLIERLRDQR